VSDDESKKWRCAWCDKPHERNDPPCDGCGHHKFEKAVVPVAPENPDHTPEPIWVCPNCGREHQKNSPPCSRCGNATLERRTPDYSDLDELGAPSYLELLEPTYVAGVAVALAAGLVLVLGVAGVGPLAGVAGGSLTVNDVPGNSETWAGLELSAVESAYVERLNERRGAGELERDGRLDDVARFYNQRRVKATYANGTLPDSRRLRDAIGDACEESPTLVPFTVTGEEFGSASDAAEALLGGAPDRITTAGGSRIGVDVHAGPDGRLFATQLTC